MSPTLLELVVAILLIWVAWQLGKIIYLRINKKTPESSPLSLPDKKHGHHR